MLDLSVELAIDPLISAIRPDTPAEISVESAESGDFVPSNPADLPLDGSVDAMSEERKKVLRALERSVMSKSAGPELYRQAIQRSFTGLSVSSSTCQTTISFALHVQMFDPLTWNIAMCSVRQSSLPSDGE